jgi:flagellar basal body-associated protein FliL
MKKKKLIPIIAAIALLAVGGGGYVVYSTVLSGGGKKKHAHETPADQRRAAEKKARAAMKLRQQARADGPTVSLGDSFLINLADPGLAHYAKFDVSFKVDAKSPMAAAGHGAGVAALDEQAAIRDIVITDAGRFKASDLTRASGVDTLPLDVYFTSLAVQ